jgi:GMP synthase-like glutamine amidotransferase
MPANLSFSTWNIHGLTHSVLGDKTKNQDFMDNISKVDFVFLTETWSKIDIDVPGFKAIVSETAMPHTDKASRLSGGITLLIKSKFEKYVSIAKNPKTFCGVKFQKIY